MEKFSIGDCFYQIRNGANIKQGIIDGGYPITRIETIANNTFNRDRMGYAGITDLSKYESYILEDGDLLMSHINSIQYLGRTVKYERTNNEKFIHGMNLLGLKANRNIIDPSYAVYYFSSPTFKEQIARITKKSVNQASFSIADLRKIIIMIPSIAKQKEIVDVLDKIKNIKNKRQQQLEALNDLNKARFVEMFGTFPKNEKNWQVGTIRELVSDVRYGSSRKAFDGDSGQYPYLRMNNITYSGELDLTETKTIDIPDEELEKCTVRRGDLLFNRTNSKELVGKTCVYDRDEMMVLAGFIVRVRMNDKAIPEFVSAFMNTDFTKQMLLSMCKAAIGQANINAQEFQNIGIYIPPIEIQKEFAAFKAQIDKSKVAVQKALDEAQLLFDSLMQEYFG